MAELRVNPTRMELKRYQLRYNTARRGHKLLKDKLNELARLHREAIREGTHLREEVDSALTSANRGFALAAAMGSPKRLREALILPQREIFLEVSYQNRMGVQVPVFSFRSRGEASKEPGYGMAFTSGELDGAVLILNRISDRLIRMAELEKTAQLLEREIDCVRRRVNALEHILIPKYLEIIRAIRLRLEENERGSITRLMKAKDMMVRSKAVDAVEDCEGNDDENSGGNL